MKKKPSKSSKYSNVTRADIADVFGVDVRTVSRWLESGLPRKPNGKYDLRVCIAWRLDELTMAAGPGEPASPQLERFRRLRSDILEIDLSEKSGKLAPIDEVIRGWCSRHRLVRDSLWSWSNRLPALLANMDRFEIAKVLKSEVYSILTAFAKDGRWTPPVDETCTDDPAKCDQRCQKEENANG